MDFSYERPRKYLLFLSFRWYIYKRRDYSPYDSGGIGGSARLIVSANDRVKVNTRRFDSQDSLDDNPLDTFYHVE